MRYEGRMKNPGCVTNLPSNPIPKRKFIPVTNPRKQQFQPPEMAENHQKQAVWTGVGGGVMAENWVCGFSRYPGCRAHFEHAIHMDFSVLLGSNGSPPPQSFTSSEKLKNKPPGEALLVRRLICL